MIAIGANFGEAGQHNSGVGLLIRSVMNAVSQERGPWVGADDFGPGDPRPLNGPYFEVGSAPAINVIFFVPGSVAQHERLTKIEASRFSRKQKLLLVAVPVPKEVADAGGSVDFVIDALHKANAIAAEVFAKKGSEPFDLAKAEAIVERVREALIARRG